MLSLTKLFDDIAETTDKKLKGKIQHLANIFKAIFIIPTAISMEAIARTGLVPRGTLERCYDFAYPFESIRSTWFKKYIKKEKTLYAGALDETIIQKAGTETFGVGKFFSSKQQRTISALSVCALSIVEVENRESYPLTNRQVVQTVEDLARIEKEKAYRKSRQNKPKGRQKGTKNKTTQEQVETALYRTTKASLEAIDAEICPLYWVADAGFNGNMYLDLLTDNKRHLITKLHRTANLCHIYDGPQKPRGAKRKFGDKVDLKSTEGIELGVCGFYGIREFVGYRGEGQKRRKLKIVICFLNKNDLSQQVILCSTDINQSGADIIKFYQSRFSIEYNFREAKQYFGLESFKSRKESRVKTSIELSFTSVFLSKLMQVSYAELLGLERVSTLDVLAMERLYYQAQSIIMMYENDPKSLLNPENIRELAKFNAVNL